MTNALPGLHTLSDTFPCFRALPAEEWAAAQPRMITVPAQSSLFRNDDADKYAFFLLSGTVAITNMSENGREALTNRLTAGDICAMMVLSGLSEREYPGKMTTETEVTVLFVAKGSFLRWVQIYEPIRHAVFGSIMDGLIHMGSLLADKTSQPVDVRLADTLLKLTSEREPTVRITHQQLAAELGSAREVVSRILSRMQKKEWIETGRGWVSIRLREALNSYVTKSQKTDRISW